MLTHIHIGDHTARPYRNPGEGRSTQDPQTVLQGASTPLEDLCPVVYEPYALRALFASLPSPPVVGLTMGIVTLRQLHTPGISHVGQKQV